MTAPDGQANDEARTRWSPHGVLWASAFVLAGLVVVQASRLGGEARAEMVSRVGEMTLLTAATGSEEILLALDNRHEQVLVYKVVNQTSVELFQKYDLARVFSDARSRSGRK